MSLFTFFVGEAHPFPPFLFLHFRTVRKAALTFPLPESSSPLTGCVWWFTFYHSLLWRTCTIAIAFQCHSWHLIDRNVNISSRVAVTSITNSETIVILMLNQMPGRASIKSRELFVAAFLAKVSRSEMSKSQITIKSQQSKSQVKQSLDISNQPRPSSDCKNHSGGSAKISYRLKDRLIDLDLALRSSSARFFFPSPTSDDSSAGNDVVANVADMVANQGVVGWISLTIVMTSTSTIVIIATIIRWRLSSTCSTMWCTTSWWPALRQLTGWYSRDFHRRHNLNCLNSRLCIFCMICFISALLWSRVYFSELVHRTGEGAADCAARWQIFSTQQTKKPIKGSKSQIKCQDCNYQPVFICWSSLHPTREAASEPASGSSPWWTTDQWWRPRPFLPLVIPLFWTCFKPRNIRLT